MLSPAPEPSAIVLSCGMSARAGDGSLHPAGRPAPRAEVDGLAENPYFSIPSPWTQSLEKQENYRSSAWKPSRARH